jgi:hypothetical protein
MASTPIKNSVGEGFTVEALVAGWVACHLLSGAPWQGKPGVKVTAMDCQAEQDGWKFDDLVIHLRENGRDSKAGCSVKSYAVFGPQGAPADFASTLWQQWRATGPSGFQPDRDSLVLISAQHPPDIREAWFGLAEEARATVPATTADRLRRETDPSPLRRRAFKSLLDSCGEAADPFLETASLLRAFHLVETDFQHASSQSATHAIALCQQALIDAERNQAAELWQSVLQHVADIRRKGGRIALPSLLAALASKFPLKQHPDYSAAWQALETESRQRMDNIPFLLAGMVSIPRTQLQDSLAASITKHRQLVLLGPSGNGKSVVARAWALASPGVALWIKANDFSVAGGVRHGFGLRQPLSEIFAHAATPVRVVLDGLDRCFDEAAFDEIASVLKAVAAAQRPDVWEVVITCIPEDWDRVRRQLIRRSVAVPVKSSTVPRLTLPELRAACDQLPALASLVQRPHLRPIMSWPKALDILATHWRSSSPDQAWATESDFSRWFWQSIIGQDRPGSLRERVARKVAVETADKMTTVLALNTLSPEEVAALRELAREGHIVIDGARDVAGFAHELIGDWARQHELHLRGTEIPTFLQPRLHSPHWHRAVRYHALALLEGEPGAARWQALFQAFNTGDVTDELAQNLMLEAPVFSISHDAVLERLWGLLEADEGGLLRRFLRQFLRVATIPNERMLAIFRDKSPDLLLEAAAIYRLPWGPYWFGALAFLARHADRVVELAPPEIADVCLKWLPLSVAFDESMEEAAKLALAGGRRFYLSEARRQYLSSSREETAVKICHALLAAAPVKPDEVAELCLKLSGRQPPAADEALADEPRARGRSRFLWEPGENVPWPDGPRADTSPAFRSAFMSGEHAAALLAARPEVAIEVLFAVLLDLPVANGRREYDHHPDQRGFNRHDIGRELCFWTSAPFLAFLRLNPALALPAIIKLVNFATERAAELPPDLRQTFSVPVTFEGKTTEWRGHQFSYLWYQVHVFGPRAAGCALLSLEKWLYLLMEENQPIEEHLRIILRESRSIALAPVLICVGKKRPDLFLTILRPLVEAVDFQVIEESFDRRGEGKYQASAFYERSSIMREQWAEWVNLPHRKEAFGQLVTRLFLSQQAWRTMIAEIRTGWQQRLAAGTPENPAPPWLPRLIAQFDLANWQVKKTADQTMIVYTPPADLPQPSPEETANMTRLDLLLFLPLACEQVLIGKKTWTEEEMEAQWARIPEVRALEVPEDEEGMRNREDGLLGIVAVAVVRHRAWLARSPEREDEAREILISIGKNQPKWFWFGEDDSTSYKWDNFAAWAMTTLWCENPDDPVLTQAVGSLVLWERYLVVGRVMAIAAAHREKLGARFDRLLAHALRYAPARQLGMLNRYDEQVKFDRKAWMLSHVDDFVAGRTKPLPADWRQLATTLPQSRANRVLRSGGLDLDHMAVALEWNADLAAARDKTERDAWLEINRQLLLCALIRIERLAAEPEKEPDPYDTNQERSPYKSEEEILKRTAKIMAGLEPGANHRQFWEPLFKLGLPASRWIESFATDWLLEAGGRDHPAPAILEQWPAMLDYAEAAPTWKTDGWRGGARDLWNDLLGLSPFGSSFWDNRMAPVAVALRPYHERWVRAHASMNYDARVYIHFLLCDACHDTRLSGLCLLREVVPLTESYFWDKGTQGVFASLLQLALEKNDAELRANPKAREAFLTFAVRLTSLQHPLGTELHALAGARFGLPASP